MQVPNQCAAEAYVAPEVTEVGSFDEVTEGQYSRSISDVGDAGGYWDK